jgi:nucleoside-diphosphate-sugar epimerase
VLLRATATHAAALQAQRACFRAVGCTDVRVLVLGASGAIGRFVLPRLLAGGHEVLAASRRPPAGLRDAGGPGTVQWHRLDLAGAPDATLAACDAVLSAGPLDLASRWLSAHAAAPPRIVAFGSTSIATKERALALRLREAEDRLGGFASRHGSTLALLRPTLVYGAGMDRNLSRIAALGRRLGWVPLPRRAHGLRQPVHADDLAQAAVGALELSGGVCRQYALPGGETLGYRDMVLRVLACLDPQPRLLELPMPLLRGALAGAHVAGLLRDANVATLLRMREDLVFDAGPAQRELGFVPRLFTVHAAMLAG